MSDISYVVLSSDIAPSAPSAPIRVVKLDGIRMTLYAAQRRIERDMPNVYEVATKSALYELADKYAPGPMYFQPLLDALTIDWLYAIIERNEAVSAARGDTPGTVDPSNVSGMPFILGLYDQALSTEKRLIERLDAFYLD